MFVGKRDRVGGWKSVMIMVGVRERERLCVSGWEMGREKETERK